MCIGIYKLFPQAFAMKFPFYDLISLKGHPQSTIESKVKSEDFTFDKHFFRFCLFPIWA